MRSKTRYFHDEPDKKDSARINNKITSREVRLIDENGENVGIISSYKAKQKAKEAELDLVQVSDANPPVCKIIDYGKYIYNKSKKLKANQKSSKMSDKEIRLRPSTGQHDLEIKARKAKEFIEEGRKVNINFKLRGREKGNIEVIHEVVLNFYDMLKDSAKLEKRGTSYILIPI